MWRKASQSIPVRQEERAIRDLVIRGAAAVGVSPLHRVVDLPTRDAARRNIALARAAQ
jgi:hypothetical protein